MFNKVPTVVDLFAGAGGFSKGFEQAGFDVVAGVDKNEKALETWSENHDGNVLQFDLTEKTPEDVSNVVSDIDVVIGGPPCQDFTKCNQKIDLDRNNLAVLFGEYVNELAPECFVMENVRYLQSKHDDVLEQLINSVTTNGYDVQYRLLDAADYGVPQHRIRAFVIGMKGEKPMFPEPTHGPDSDSDKGLVTAGEALEGVELDQDESELEVTSKHAPLLSDIPEGMNYSFYTENMGHPNPQFEWRSRFSDYLYKADSEKPVRTLKAQPGGASGPFHWENRRFGKNELKRLHSFPDEYEFDFGWTETMRQIGNAVPPRLAWAIACTIREQLFGVKVMSTDTELNFRSRKRTSSEEYQQKASERLSQLYGEGIAHGE